jgi:ApaG protein
VRHSKPGGPREPEAHEAPEALESLERVIIRGVSEEADDKGPDDRQSGRSGKTGIRGSDTTTDGIRVQVRTTYLADRSSPREHQFYFAYTITVSNVGETTAQLVSRHWIITDADGDVQEVRGEGVVGHQPVLEPGTSFEYTSYCHLRTNVGTMHGSYQMVRPDGETFDARIAPFTLAVPNALN